VRTQELYDGLLRNHLLPTFGAISLGSIDEASVRRWRKERLEAGRRASRKFGPLTAAKAYLRPSRSKQIVPLSWGFGLERAKGIEPS
jgi:hypothetical protein